MEVVVAVFKGIYHLLTAPYAEIQPFIERIITLVVTACVLRVMIRRCF